jgi:hypothetical protein
VQFWKHAEGPPVGQATAVPYPVCCMNIFEPRRHASWHGPLRLQGHYCSRVEMRLNIGDMHGACIGGAGLLPSDSNAACLQHKERQV